MQRWFTTIRVILSITNLWLGATFLYTPMTRIGHYAADNWGIDPVGMSYLMGILLLLAGVVLMFDPKGWRLAIVLSPFIAYNVVTALVTFTPGMIIPAGGSVISFGILAMAIAYVGLISQFRHIAAGGKKDNATK